MKYFLGYYDPDSSEGCSIFYTTLIEATDAITALDWFKINHLGPRPVDDEEEEEMWDHQANLMGVVETKLFKA